MKQTTLARAILWIGIATVGISLWGRIISPMTIFWWTLAGGLFFMIVAGTVISKEK